MDLTKCDEKIATKDIENLEEFLSAEELKIVPKEIST